MELQLYDAASHGKLSLIKHALEHRPKSERISLLSTKISGATPLIAACRNGHYDVAEYLIKNCGADVELVGSVIFDGETIDGVPPLWCAAAAGHLKIVSLLVQNKANVNSTTKTQSSPLRAACYDGHFDIVQYLVLHGADIELANRHGHTCLMISCYKNHYAIAKFLIDKGADINRKSVKANTALHDCAESGALTIMKLLLSRGAKFDKDSYGMSPLLAAAVAGHGNIVEYCLSMPSLVKYEDKIDALELLGATFVDNRKDMLGAHKYWKRAINMRYLDGNLLYPKPVTSAKVYEGRCEVITVAELDELISDPDEMRMQSLMVRERVLGPGHPDTSYYIRYRGAVYADSGQFDRCIALWMYALNMQQTMHEPLSPLTQGSFLSFAELFWFMIGDKRTSFHPTPELKFEDSFLVFWKAVREVELSQSSISRMPEKQREMVLSFQRLLVITLQLLTVLLCISKTPEEEFKFRKTVYELIKLNPKGTGGLSLVHIAAVKNSNVGRFALKIFPSPKTIAFLCDIGADINARDELGNTPLILAAQTQSASNVELTQVLLSCGAHLDETNDAKQTFDDIVARSNFLPRLSQINRLNYLSLKCLAARVVSKHKILVTGNVPVPLESFIQKH